MSSSHRRREDDIQYAFVAVSRAAACGSPYGPELTFAHKIPKINSSLKEKLVGLIKVVQGGTEMFNDWSKEARSYWLD